MAHIKTGIDYYAHTVGMTRDRRLRAMRRKFGSTGIDVWFTLLDMIYSDKGYYLDFTGDERENTLMDIAQEVSGKDSPDEDEIADMIQAFVGVGLLDDRLYQMGVISSAEIQEQYYMSTLRRRRVELNTDIWLLDEEKMNFLSVSSPILENFSGRNSDDTLRNAKGTLRNANNDFCSAIDTSCSDVDSNLQQSKVKKSKVKESREKAEKSKEKAEESKEKAEESKVNAPACEPADALSSDCEQVSCDIPESLPAQELDYTQYSSYVIDDENGEPVPYIPSGEPAVMQEDAPVYGVDIPFPEPPPDEEYDPDAYDFSLEELAQRSPVGAAVARMLSHCNIITEDGRSIPVTEYQPDRKGKPAAPLPAPLPVQNSSDGVEHKPDEALMASLTRTAMQGGTIDVSSEIAKICAEGARNSALFEQKYGSHEEYQRQMDEKALASGEVTIIKMPKPKPPEELPPQHKALAQRYGENNVQQYLVRYRQWCERNGRPADDPYPAIERWMAKDLCR